MREIRHASNHRCTIADCRNRVTQQLYQLFTSIVHGDTIRFSLCRSTSVLHTTDGTIHDLHHMPTLLANDLSVQLRRYNAKNIHIYAIVMTQNVERMCISMFLLLVKLVLNDP